MTLQKKIVDAINGLMGVRFEEERTPVLFNEPWKCECRNDECEDMGFYTVCYSDARSKDCMHYNKDL